MKRFLRKYRMCCFVVGVLLMVVIVFGITWAVLGVPETLQANLIEVTRWWSGQ